MRGSSAAAKRKKRFSRASSFSSCRRLVISRAKVSRRSDIVRPSAIAFRKFAASRMADGVNPGGGSKTRFSTAPSSVTSTAMAVVLRGDRSTPVVRLEHTGIEATE